MIQRVTDALRQNSEQVALVVYFVAMLVCAAPLASALGSAWEDGSAARELLQLPAQFGVTITMVSVGLLGFFLALLTLMTLDPKKRWQGFMLWASFLVAMVGLASQGVFINEGAGVSDFVDVAPWLAIGFVPGLLVGGGRRLVNTRTTDALEFRRASTGVFAFIAILVVVGVVEYHLSYPLPIDVTADGVEMVQATQAFGPANTGDLPVNAAAAGVFLFVARRFIQYDAEENFLVLGPRGSGKSLFLVGAFLKARDRSEAHDAATPMNPSADLMSIVDQVSTSDNEWFVESTGQDEIKDLEFSYVHGSVFPKNVGISSLDYAGELLPRVSNALTSPTEETDERLAVLIDKIREADTLILLLDVERFENNESLEIEPYFNILRETKEAKNVLLVATKADYLAEDFQEERGQRAHRNYEDFRAYAKERLKNENEQVSTLLMETAGADVLPVYYQTRVTEAGERVPAGSGTPVTVGFDELIDRLGES